MITRRNTSYSRLSRRRNYAANESWIPQWLRMTSLITVGLITLVLVWMAIASGR